MAKKPGKGQDLTLWDRFMKESNQRVFWVVLLCAISFLFAFPEAGSIGRQVATGSVDVFGKVGRQVRTSKPSTSARDQIGRLVPGVLQSPTYNRSVSTPKMLYAYREEAKRMGLAVSDAELGETRRRAWRGTVRQRASLSPARRIFRRKSSRRCKLRSRSSSKSSTRSGRSTDRTGTAGFASDTNMSPAQFEEALREALLISKLGGYVYVVRQRQREGGLRSLSRAAREAQAELARGRSARRAPGEGQGELHRRRSSDAPRDESPRVSPRSRDQLRLPVVSAQSLRRAGQGRDHRRGRSGALRRGEDRIPPSVDSRRRRSVLASLERRDGGAEKSLYKSFDEVAEEVREKLIDTRALKAENDLRKEVDAKLSPSDGSKPATFEDLAKEYPFAVLGSVPPTVEGKVNDVFGEEATSYVVRNWFTTVKKDGDLSEGQRNALSSAKTLDDGKGFAVFRKVTIASSLDPELADIRARSRSRS